MLCHAHLILLVHVDFFLSKFSFAIQYLTSAQPPMLAQAF